MCGGGWELEVRDDVCVFRGEVLWVMELYMDHTANMYGAVRVTTLSRIDFRRRRCGSAAESEGIWKSPSSWR